MKYGCYKHSSRTLERRTKCRIPYTNSQWSEGCGSVGLCEQSSDFPAQFLQLEHARNGWQRCWFHVISRELSLPSDLMEKYVGKAPSYMRAFRSSLVEGAFQPEASGNRYRYQSFCACSNCRNWAGKSLDCSHRPTTTVNFRSLRTCMQDSNFHSSSKRSARMFSVSILQRGLTALNHYWLCCLDVCIRTQTRLLTTRIQ
jgi:hypothetical protein